MKKWMMVVLMMISVGMMVMSDAQARRMGGGGSFGRQSQSVSKRSFAPPSQMNQAKPAPAPAAPVPGAPKPASPWKGILGGALLGLGLGALMSHFGFGGAMGGMLGTILMIALLGGLVLLAVRFFRAKSESQNLPAFAGGMSSYRSESAAPVEMPLAGGSGQSIPMSSVQQGSDAPWGVPADFDEVTFLRNAKTYFIRLQAAWDKADSNDIREFTTPEMFGELKLQLHERGVAGNYTDVMQLDAVLLGIETVGNDYLASVKFSGMIKEAEHAQAEPFSEVWNMSKPVSGQGGWLLAGIQQLS